MGAKRQIVEFLCNQKPVQALLESAMAIFLEPEQVWISGAGGQYAWSHGSAMGMKGEAEPVGNGDGFIVASLHQGSVAMCFNMDAGFHIFEVRPINGGRQTVFKLAKTGLLGPSEPIELLWTGEKFEAYKPEEVK
jgi:hypothetical protein